MYKKRTRILILLLAILMSIQFTFALNIFRDTDNHWSKDYVRWVTNDMEIMSGFEDGTFRPNSEMSRIDFVVALNNLIKNNQLDDIHSRVIDETIISYGDISKDSWEYNQIIQLETFILKNKNYKLSIMDIIDEKNFLPNKGINRYEALLLSTAVASPPIEYVNNTYTDLDRNIPNYNYIIEGISNGFIKGYEDNTLRLDKKITRAEAATVLMRIGKDLEHVGIRYLTYKRIEMKDNSKDLPQFQKPVTGDSYQNNLHNRFIKAIASQQYIEFIGYIPINERHLYDENPLETLWELKRLNYVNVVGNNYYLIKYDKSLQKERILELVNEGIDYLLLNDQAEIEGLNIFFSLVMEMLPIDIGLKAIEEYFVGLNNANMKLVTGILLIDYYSANNQSEKLINVYKNLVKSIGGLPEETVAKIIQNYIYLVYDADGEAEALKESQVIFNDLITDGLGQYLDFVLRGLIKELIKLNSI